MKFHTVAEYMDYQPHNTKDALESLITCILGVIKEADVVINYNIIAIPLVKDGKRDQQIMIAGYPHHIGFYPSVATIEKFSEQLTGFKKGKGSVQFPLTQPLPYDVIIEMVRYTKEHLHL